MAFNFAKYGQSLADQHDPAEQLSRQLNLLVAQLDAAAGSTTGAISSTPIDALRCTQLIRHLADLSNANHSEVASQSLQKASTKANALITSHVARTEALYCGYSLAVELAEQVGWQHIEENVVERYGQAWVGAATTYLSVTSGQAPPSASIAKGQEIPPDARVLGALLTLLLNHILSPEAQARPEYARAVVTPNLPKVAGSLVLSLESIARRLGQKTGPGEVACFNVLTSAVTRHLEAHPNLYRPFVSRLHGACTPIIVSSLADRQLVHSATRLLGCLYLTGALATTAGKSKELAGSIAAGKASQSQLWLATTSSAVHSAREAWTACVSTFEHAGDLSPRKATMPFPPLPEDPVQAQSIAQARLQRLIGPHGVLLQLLKTPTRKVVPVPLKKLFALAYDMLAVDSETPAKQNVETELHVMQSVNLASLHLLALRLLEVCVKALHASGTAALSRFGPSVLDRLLRILEHRNTSTRAVRAAASQAIARLVTGCESHCAASLLLDPSSRLVLRTSRACLGEVSRLLVSDSSAFTQNMETSSSAGARSKKRSRMYDSDAILSSTSSAQVLYSKSMEDQASAVACLRAFPVLYAHLSTSLTPTHYDLAHAGVQTVMTVAELLIRSGHPSQTDLARRWAALTAASLDCVASLIATSTASTPFLSLLCSRASHLAAYTTDLVSQTASTVAVAAANLQRSLGNVTLPRLPPVLSSRVEPHDHDVAEEEGRTRWEMDAETGQSAKSKTGPMKASIHGSLHNVADAVHGMTGVQMRMVAPVDDVDDEDPAVQAGSTAVEAITGAVTASATPTKANTFKGPRHSSPTPVTRNDDADTSMEPTKPTQRPSTPKIGSPARTSAGSPESRAAGGGVGIAPGSPEAREIFGGSGATISRDFTSSVAAAQSPPSGVVRTTLAVEESDDDDEEMPEIDIRSSDEEDVEEE